MLSSRRSQLPLFIVFFFFNVPSAFNVFRGILSYKHIHSRCVCLRADNSLISENEIEILVTERARHRKERNYTAADSIKKLLDSQHDVEVIDYPKSSWRYIQRSLPDPESFSSYSALTEIEQQDSLMWLASNAYDLLHSNSRSEDSIVRTALHHLKYTDTSKSQDSSSIKEMQGRKFADAAFEFSLAGVTSDELYNLLSLGATTEMKRYGRRNSCRPIDILQVVEKLAVSGILNQEIYVLAADILRYKSDRAPPSRPLSYDMAISKLSSGSFSLFSDMPLLWLWRFSARQRKHGNQVGNDKILLENDGEEMVSSSSSSGSTSSSSSQSRMPLQLPLFDDPTLPLVVDIGCGYGVSMLGLSHREGMMDIADPTVNPTVNPSANPTVNPAVNRSGVRKHNYIACDMSHRAISYANSISHRWGTEGRCQFVEADAITFLNLILKEYSGPIECVLINFPTPYQFGAEHSISNQSTDENGVNQEYTENEIKKNEEDSSVRGNAQVIGNAQLPRDMTDFMVTPEMIQLCGRILRKHSIEGIEGVSSDIDDEVSILNKENKGNKGSKGNEGARRNYLVVQTNVEDVAVTIKNIVLGIKGFKIPEDIQEISDISQSWHSSSAPSAADITSSASGKSGMSGVFGSIDSISPTVKNESVEVIDTDAGSTGIYLDSQDLKTKDDSNNTENERKDDEEDVHENEQEQSQELSPILVKRAEKWISSGGERAIGHGWLKSNPLPRHSRTETEAMCEHENKPEHRIIFFYD